MLKCTLAAVVAIGVCAGAARAQSCPTFNPAKVMAQAHFPQAGLMLVGAHRGVWEYVPENTIPALNAAIANCIEMTEFDVRMTSDGIPALIHDWNLQRVSNLSGMIYDTPNATWLAATLYDRHGVNAAQHPPTLSQLLDAMNTQTTETLILDCKDTLSVPAAQMDANLKTSVQVLAATYAAIAGNSAYKGLLSRIIFKIRFPELPNNPTDLLHELGIEACDNTPTSACTHLNLVAIYYSADPTNPLFPNFATTTYPNYMALLGKSSNPSWFWYPEVVVKYPNDLLQATAQTGVAQGFGMTAFAATEDWAEGTSQGAGLCCSSRNYAMPVSPSLSNFTGDFEYLVALQQFNWITSDKSIEAVRYLTARSLRNTSIITGP